MTENLLPKAKLYIKDHVSDIYSFLKNWFHNFIEKTTGNKREDYKMTTAVVVIGIFYLFASGVWVNLKRPVLALVRSLNSDQINAKSNSAAVASSNPIKIDSPVSTTSELTQKCNLNNGPWNPWYGKVTQGLEDKNYLILPTSSHGVLFQYTGKIDDIDTCEFEFIPRGESTINYVISLDGIYQIVIGDNDMWTVTLKATDQIDGDLVPILEAITEKTRPRLLNRVRKGTAVKVLLAQKFLDNKKYEVSAEIIYKPDINSSSETLTEKFTWLFDPSPSILDSARLSVGLVRSSKDTSEIGASFITPSLISK